MSRLVLPTETKGPLLSRLPNPGQKDPLLSRPGVPGWKTGTTKISQPAQINLSVVVIMSRCWGCKVLCVGQLRNLGMKEWRDLEPFIYRYKGNWMRGKSYNFNQYQSHCKHVQCIETIQLVYLYFKIFSLYLGCA